MKTTGEYPRVLVDTAAVSTVGYAGGVLLTETIRATSLDLALTGALGPRPKPLATHDPAKMILDLAVMGRFFAYIYEAQSVDSLSA